ncbi:MAG: hypothetical protein BAJALOKI2v1_40075 [Promethearchaeota archaeon]|nr:MAG: hypothetical protein BAJALOKI2v1_40075 [Candidatus Lokiarchaeota archaeon]
MRKIGRRVYVKGKKTHAEDERFEQDNVGEEKERFQVNIDLVSLKTIKDYDILGRVGEFYFKVDGEKAFKTRFPHKGVIKLQRNQTFTTKADMSLWNQFKTVKTGEDASVKVKVILREKDHLKKDETVAEQEFNISLPQKTDYVILQDDEENTKVKLRIQSTRTRY